MHVDDYAVWQMLHGLDESQTLEVPDGYDFGRERDRFNRLAQHLDTAFSCVCRVDRDVQDASLHGRIEIPASATLTGHPLVVNISNFGGLAVLAVDNPGIWTDAETATLLHPADAHRVETALAGLGYTLIPEELLWQPYDGASDPARFGRSEVTWWNRYFDYL
jgi:hypothetical protein